MIDLEFITRNKRSVKEYISEEHLVYFLLDSEDLVHVGDTVNFNQRVKQHMQSKTSGDYYLLKYKNKEEMDELEFDYMFKFEPRYNKLLQTSDKFLTVNKIKERYNLGDCDFKRFIKKHDIKHKVCLSGILHYDVDDFKELEV